MLATPLPNIHHTINPHTASPPSSPINKPLHHPQYQPPEPQSPTTLFTISSTKHPPYLKTALCQRQNRRTKPRKPPPSLKPNLFLADWFRRKKRARYKPGNFMDRKEFLAVSNLGLKMPDCGKRGKGLGKGGSKRQRKVLWDNIWSFTNPATRRLARKWGGEHGTQTHPGLWLRVLALGRRQGTCLRRMGSVPMVPTEQESS
jgi:hypothetical protein